MLKRLILTGVLALLTAIAAFAQRAAIKTNLLYDATTTFNLGMEFKTGARTTFNLPVNVNPWTFSDNKKWKHVLVQPELRFWTCEPFSRHFFGIHAHYAFYNAGGFGPFTQLKEYRYEGWLAGGGVSYGYNWLLSSRWSLEATIGLGYAFMDYEKFECYKCGTKMKDDTYHYFGPTKAGITLIYYLK